MSINLCLNDDHAPLSSFAVCKHLLECRPVVVRSRGGAVDIFVHHKKIVLFRILFADVELTFYRLLSLRIARVTGIDDCCFQYKLPPNFFAFMILLYGRGKQARLAYSFHTVSQTTVVKPQQSEIFSVWLCAFRRTETGRAKRSPSKVCPHRDAQEFCMQV